MFWFFRSHTVIQNILLFFMMYGSLINMFYLEVGTRTVVLCTLCVNFKAISRNMWMWRHICVVSLQIKFLSHFVYLLFIIFL